jgi:hypothetical protein
MTTPYTKINLHTEGYSAAPKTVTLATEGEIYPKELLGKLQEAGDEQGNLETAPSLMCALIDLVRSAHIINPQDPTRHTTNFEYHSQEYTLSLFPEEFEENGVILTVENALGEEHSMPVGDWAPEQIGSVG